MDISIINPSKKKKAHKAKRKTKRTTTRARKGKRVKATTPRTAKRRTNKKHKAKKTSKKHKTKRRTSAKQKAAARRNLKKARAARRGKKAGKKRKKGRKGKRVRGKAIRPVMYKHRSKSGRKVLKHSPKSRYARRGYRFNPKLSGLAKLAPGVMRPHIISMKGAKFDAPHIVGGIGGVVTSGVMASEIQALVGQVTQNTIVLDLASLGGNVLGTEVPAAIVHAIVKSAVSAKNADAVARGWRVGGYVAMGLNAMSMFLTQVLKVNLPVRMLSGREPIKELMFHGMGDMDLALTGLGSILQPGGGSVAYAALGQDEQTLDQEISALSAYLGDNLDNFGGVTGDDGLSP